ncbi:MAG: helix-turn-helix domain-containing protein [Clostridia bacterium]|nr:helix-turn-helix domain-containing protein [Clostridia bacterium]MCI2000583.1 helix-turn-helix domain-containing protein [Clostridia bacterium]MCI2015039.1 helix-turn-helix domain-containing protein [Clostridia bacterium]
MEVNDRITFLRNQKGLTVNKLANLAGISQSFLREIELGNKKPTIETLSLVCNALDISLKDFFDDSFKSNLQKNELQQEIFRLTPEQTELLTKFLKSLHE